MTGPFEGPQALKTGHGRLLYHVSDSPQTLWSDWPKSCLLLDEYLRNQPKLHLATGDAYLYFFGRGSKEAWFAREIIGHQSRFPEGVNGFDFYASEVFEWKLPLEKALLLKNDDISQIESQLRTLAGEALAPTWRIKLSAFEGEKILANAHSAKSLEVSFQFYKLV